MSNIKEIVKDAFKSDLNKNDLSTVEYEDIWNRIDSQVSNWNKPLSDANKKINLKYCFTIIGAAALFVFCITGFYFYKNHTNENHVVINNQGSSVTPEHKELKLSINAGEPLPCGIRFNNKFYDATDMIVSKKSIKEKVGKNELYTGVDLFEVRDSSISEKVAVSVDGEKYLVYKVKSDFSEEEAISTVLNTHSFLEKIGNLSFLNRVGSIQTKVIVNGKSIAVNLETKIKNKGNYNYIVTLVESWNPSDYNLNNIRGDDVFSHSWSFDVIPSEATLTDSIGQPVPQLSNR